MTVNPRSFFLSVLLLTAALAGCGTAAGPGRAAAADSTKPHSSPASPAAQSTAPSAAQAQPSASAQPAGSSAPPTGGTTVSASSASVHPGHATPADAVDGFYQALLDGNFKLACSYVLPDEPCGTSASVRATGNITIGKTEISTSGVYALVEVTGQICGSGGTGCESNSNPSAGLPTGSETVTQAWADSVVTGNGFAPTRAEESSDGGWDVDLTGNSD